MMAKKGQLIGFKQCNDCGDPHCEVRLDKNANPYGICFRCEPPSQDFTMGRAERLARFKRQGFRPAEGQPMPEWAKDAAPPSPTKKPDPAPAPRKATLLG